MTTHHTDEKKPARGGQMHIGEFLVAVAQASAAINVAALAVCATRVGHCSSGSE